MSDLDFMTVGALFTYKDTVYVYLDGVGHKHALAVDALLP